VLTAPRTDSLRDKSVPLLIWHCSSGHRLLKHKRAIGAAAR
jgi:hypothetical protein